jgi:FMN phosphatase YigB (HAD superfamily)
MKKIAFVDADDVFLQWIPDFNEHLAKLGYLPEEGAREYIPQAWGYPELLIRYEDVQDYIQNGPMHPPYPEMIETLRKLRKNGWEVVIITSHPTNKMMERIANIASFGQFYDHIVFSLAHDTNGKAVSISKAKYIQQLYIEPSIKIFVDDRLRSVNEFVELGLGYGFSMDRAYNDKDLEIMQSNPLLERRIFLGRGKTMRDQILDLIPKIEEVTNSLSTKIFAVSKEAK